MSDEIINNLRLIGDIFSNAIARKIRESKIENLQAELTEKHKFEEILALYGLQEEERNGDWNIKQNQLLGELTNR